MPTGDLPKGWRKDVIENELWNFDSEKYAGEKFLRTGGQMAVEKSACGYTVGWSIENLETGKYLEYVNRSDAVKFDEELKCIQRKDDAIRKARDKQKDLSDKYFRKLKSSGFFDIYK